MRVVYVGSGEVYGALARGERATEERRLAPVSPYASSKASAELAALQFHRSYGLPVVCARPFNHLGAGQAPNFLVPDVARQIDEIHRAVRPARIVLGNVQVVRDFSHVLDVVRAYSLLAREGQPGEVYNICSGEPRTIRSVVDEMVALGGVSAEIVISDDRKRPGELESLVGDATKLRALGWTPRLTVADALRDALEEARAAA
jgi:GDP-4-dehydro-6-deoxy-D-mannose reductase